MDYCPMCSFPLQDAAQCPCCFYERPGKQDSSRQEAPVSPWGCLLLLLLFITALAYWSVTHP